MEQQAESSPFDYWGGENADWPVVDWKYDVANGDTRLGYWEWVEANKDACRVR